MVGLTEKVAFQQSPKGGEVAIGLAGRRVVSAQGIVRREALRQEDVVKRIEEEEVRLERWGQGERIPLCADREESIGHLSKCCL